MFTTLSVGGPDDMQLLARNVAAYSAAPRTTRRGKVHREELLRRNLARRIKIESNDVSLKARKAKEIARAPEPDSSEDLSAESSDEEESHTEAPASALPAGSAAATHSGTTIGSGEGAGAALLTEHTDVVHSQSEVQGGSGSDPHYHLTSGMIAGVVIGTFAIRS
jgi:hypothetical protein